MNEPIGGRAGVAPGVDEAFHRAVALHRDGRLDDAIIAYGSVASRRPDHLGALCNLGIALKQAGRINEAITAYQRALDVDPNFADARFNLGIVFSMVGRHGEAMEAYRRVLALKPDLAAAHANLGNTLKKAGRHGEALESYRSAITLKPDHLGALINMGETLSEMGRHEAAAEVFRNALDLRPGFVPALARMSGTLAELGRYDQAVEAARRALAHQPDSLEALAGLTMALEALGRSDEILAAYRAALAANPDFANGYCKLAELHLKQNEPAAALVACDSCLARHPGHARSLAIKGVALGELGEADGRRALVDFDRLIYRKQWRSAPGYDTLDEFNAAASQHILNHPSLTYELHGTATRQGRHTGELLVEPKGPMDAFERMICSAVADYDKTVGPDPSHPFLAHPPQAWSLNVWAVVLEGQGYQESHIHPSGWLSGVYYVRLPGVVEDDAANQAGWIEFGQPLDHLKANTPPELLTIKPEAGSMLLFPSYFFHRTLPFEDKATRISIAFDVVPLGAT